MYPIRANSRIHPFAAGKRRDPNLEEKKRNNNNNNQ
jgi:hypothetical protein